jgi:hypothetical protein
MSKWTVIGFWYEDEPVVAGVVAGDTPVFGGSDLLENEGAGFQGPLGLTVEARDAEAAEERAVQEMTAARLEAIQDPNTPNRVEDDPWWKAHAAGGGGTGGAL